MKYLNLQFNRKTECKIIIDNFMVNSLDLINSYINFNKFSNFILITNYLLFNTYFNEFKQYCNIVLNKSIYLDHFIISDTEQHKTLDTVLSILNYLFTKKYSRDTLLFALGGGVIGDICGLVSSLYYRGISYISIPTTLLAQVDASIGGKNGVNNLYGKNIIGTIYQPLAVIINIPFLFTLSVNSFKDGLAEVVKYALGFDIQFFGWLKKHLISILDVDESNLEYCINKCCTIKNKIIQNDELEKYDSRILLNLGHTYAHALETYYNYKKFTHGQAVSIGLILSMYTSHLMNFVSTNKILQVMNLLKLIDLPIQFPYDVDIDKYYNIMMHDKKILNNQLSLIIPQNIGNAYIYRDVSKLIIRQTLELCFKNNR